MNTNNTIDNAVKAFSKELARSKGQATWDDISYEVARLRYEADTAAHIKHQQQSIIRAGIYRIANR